ncbi:hypothetical protein LUZ60_017192 [Juncus effusus]|nr:hypothetical protein LUZ60_017192 [Juncus effusus]
MSGAPRVRSLNNSENDPRPVLVPGGNKTLTNPPYKPALKPVPKPIQTRPVSLPVSPNKKKQTESNSQKALKRHEMFLHSNLSLNASCSSVESFASRASTGRIMRRVGTGMGNRPVKREKSVVRVEKSGGACDLMPGPGPQQEFSDGKKRCAWITPNTEPCYVAFHDEEWGVPVHDDKRLFELLVLCGALAELTWPEILSKRQLFREVFMDFDVKEVSKLNDKKLLAQGSVATSLLSEPKIRAIIENSREILKIIEEFGSFNKYCWNFVNQKSTVNKFRYARQVPVKSPKAELISKDFLKRGLRSVGPTVVYSFMQVAGLTNDHLMSCFRFEECFRANEETPCGGSGLVEMVNGMSVS